MCLNLDGIRRKGLKERTYHTLRALKDVVINDIWKRSGEGK